MARFRKIDPRIWNDAKFSALSAGAQRLFLFLLTCPQMTLIGAVPMRSAAVAAELGLDLERYEELFAELYSMGMVFYDDRGLIWVRNFLKYNAPDNPKVVIAWRDSLDLLPECQLLNTVIESCRKHCESRGANFLKAFRDGIGKGFGNGIAYPMPYQKQEQELKQKPKEERSRAEEVSCPSLSSDTGKKVSVPDLPEEWIREAEKLRQDVNVRFIWEKMTNHYRTKNIPVEDWKEKLMQWVNTERTTPPEIGNRKKNGVAGEYNQDAIEDYSA